MGIWIMSKAKVRQERLNKKPEESRHYTQIWDKVICPVFKVVSDECDPEFRKRCGLTDKHPEGWRRQLELEYRALRRDLKDLCYGSHDDTGLLDGRKIAAVFCKALIRKKAFRFDLDAACALMREKKERLSPVGFNLWAAQNVYINYKLAYYASLQLVYLTLLYDLQASEDTKGLALALNKRGHLYRYPAPSGADSFDVNIILGLARADLSRRDVDAFLFAMQLYQVEMYSVEMLKKELAEEMTQRIAEDASKTPEKREPPPPPDGDKTKTFDTHHFPIYTPVTGPAAYSDALQKYYKHYTLAHPGQTFVLHTPKVEKSDGEDTPSFYFMVCPSVEVEYPKAPPPKTSAQKQD